TDPAWELVAVDDGSTDASGPMLEAYTRRDRRIRVHSVRRVVCRQRGRAGADRGEPSGRGVPPRRRLYRRGLMSRARAPSARHRRA
ncbi:MAG: glycosyltransferase, partial [Candidatus Rokuibacteriota bacterium]